MTSTAASKGRLALRPRTWLAVGASLAVVVAASALNPEAAPAKPGVFYGVVPAAGSVPPDSDFAAMAAGGVDSARLSIQWPYVESTPGTYDWSASDLFVQRAIAHGIEPVAFIYGTAAWAAERDGLDCPAIESCVTMGPRSGATRAAFAAFAREAVERYGPGGEFFAEPPPCETEAASAPPETCPTDPPCGCTASVPIRRWQVWNEQNSPTYYAPDADARGYAALLIRTSREIRAADPGAEVIMGGMWGPDEYLAEPETRPVVPISLYLKRLYRVAGVKKAFEAIGVHPYSQNVSGSLAQLATVRRSLDRAGDRGVGIWITEIGWASGGPPDEPYVKGVNGQALLAARALAAYEAKRRAFRLRGVFWYSWRDDPLGNQVCSWCGHAGLRTRSGLPKPAWEAFVRAARG